MEKFTSDTFSQDAALGGEFLLGYHSQRLALWYGQGAAAENQDQPIDNNG
jgi:hypothetical protein